MNPIAEPAVVAKRAVIPRSKRPLPKGKVIPASPVAVVWKASAHSALSQFDPEQIAELALLGLRYQALGAGVVDFSDPSRLDVYWTGARLVEKAVKEAIKAEKAKHPLAMYRAGNAAGHLAALFNCSVISSETYMKQYDLLLAKKHGGRQ